MNFKEYQNKAEVFAIYKDKVIYPTLGLSSEAGEVCGKIKKILRDQDGEFTEKNNEELAAELGDVLRYISAIATDLGLDLNQIAQKNIDKLESRKNRNKIQGSGDNR